MIKTDTILTDSLAKALETMAFLTIMPLEEDMSAPEKTVLAEISFAGPNNGTIQILAGLDLCRILAENIGALTEVNDETCYDALKELSNVTCGLLLPMLASSQADVFDVTVPAVKTGDDSPGWDEFVEQPNNCILNIEGFLVATKLIMKE
jgi:CheY-specific phosphatase CheX